MSKNLLQRIKDARIKVSIVHTSGEDVTDAKLNLNSLMLEGSSNIRDMSQTAGWELLTDVLRTELRNKIKRIYRLASDLDKNKNEIMELRGTCEAITEILSTVNKWKDKNKVLNDEISKLIGTVTKT